MDFIKKRINLYSVSILVLSLLLLVFYFVVNYCGLKLNRESLGLNDRYIGISAFAMTFGSEDWDREYIFNFWPIFLLVIPLSSIILVMFKQKYCKLITAIINLLGIVFILIGYCHMANLYNGNSGIIGEIWKMEFSLAGYIYIVLFLFAIVISSIYFINELKKK